MNRRSLRILASILLFAAGHLFGQSVRTPAAGTAERKAIMDTLRPPVEKDLRQPVIFKVERLRVSGPWAFAFVVPIKPDGGEINYAKTRYREDLAAGAFDPQLATLLHKEGDRWKIVESSFGATDVPWVDWPAKHRCPKALFE